MHEGPLSALAHSRLPSSLEDVLVHGNPAQSFRWGRKHMQP